MAGEALVAGAVGMVGRSLIYTYHMTHGASAGIDSYRVGLDIRRCSAGTGSSGCFTGGSGGRRRSRWLRCSSGSSGGSGWFGCCGGGRNSCSFRSGSSGRCGSIGAATTCKYQ